MYYNTTKEIDTTEIREKTTSQNKMILDLFRKYKKLGASDIVLIKEDIPVTSVRRSINTLKNAGQILETGKQVGMYNRKEYTYKINE